MFKTLSGGAHPKKTVATPKSVCGIGISWVLFGLFFWVFLGFLCFLVFFGFFGVFLGFFLVFWVFGVFVFLGFLIRNWHCFLGVFWFILGFLVFFGFLLIFEFEIAVGFLPHLQPYFWILAFFNTATRQGMQP